MKANVLLGWIGTVLAAIGALIIALNLSVSGYAFIPYLISSLVWFMSAWIDKNKPLMTLNVMFTIINIIGIIRWLL